MQISTSINVVGHLRVDFTWKNSKNLEFIFLFFRYFYIRIAQKSEHYKKITYIIYKNK